MSPEADAAAFASLWVAGPDACTGPGRSATGLPPLKTSMLGSLRGLISGGTRETPGERAVWSLKATVVAQDTAVGAVGHYFRQWVDRRRAGALLVLNGGKGSGKSMTTRVLAYHAERECEPLLLSGLSLTTQAQITRWLINALAKCPRSMVVIDDAHLYDVGAVFYDVPDRLFKRAFVVLVDYPDARVSAELAAYDPVTIRYNVISSAGDIRIIARRFLEKLVCKHAMEGLGVTDAVFGQIAIMTSGEGGAREVVEVLAQDLEPLFGLRWQGATCILDLVQGAFELRRIYI